MSSLYRRLLGEDLDRLPESLRRFHDASGPVEADGQVCVTCGVPLLARIARLPSEARQAELYLRVEPLNGGEVWIRRINGKTIRTFQSIGRRGVLIERTGLHWMGIEVRVVDGSLTFRQISWNGIKRFGSIPGLPSVSATARGTRDGWHIHVQVDAVGFGKIVAYEGEIVPR